MSHEIISNLTQHLRKSNFLKEITSNFQQQLKLIPIIGVEIEFYLSSASMVQIINAELDLVVKAEKGPLQYEIDLPPTRDIVQLEADIAQIKQQLVELCISYQQQIFFNAKPYADQYGNALHFHVNFLRDDGSNLFDDILKVELAARSLCFYLLPHFLIFAPYPEDYQRFYQGFMAPTHLCYGGNNRTVAIRIPASVPIRLEHRIAAPTSDSYLCLSAILEALWQGLINPESIPFYPKIYGNAYDEQYQLQKLPSNLEEAVALWQWT